MPFSPFSNIGRGVLILDLEPPPVILVIRHEATMVSTFVGSREQCQMAAGALRKATDGKFEAWCYPPPSCFPGVALSDAPEAKP